MTTEEPSLHVLGYLTNFTITSTWLSHITIEDLLPPIKFIVLPFLHTRSSPYIFASETEGSQPRHGEVTVQGTGQHSSHICRHSATCNLNDQATGRRGDTTRRLPNNTLARLTGSPATVIQKAKAGRLGIKTDTTQRDFSEALLHPQYRVSFKQVRQKKRSETRGQRSFTTRRLLCGS